MANSPTITRTSLLWRTIMLITLFVVLSQVVVYFWIQRSVSEHFEVMDAEILTHAAFNLRKTVNDEHQARPIPEPATHTHSAGLNYDIQVFAFDMRGQPLSHPNDTEQSYSASDNGLRQLDILDLRQQYGDNQFDLSLQQRHYRAIILDNQQTLYLIILPIDVHHLYLNQFNFQLRLILLAITLLLISVAALSVYWGFSPLSTFVQKMKGISTDQLDERIVVHDMPSELRPLAKSYNLMMDKLKDNFESLSRFSDHIAHELRTPIANLVTQTQVMLSRPRSTEEYIEQLHHQHDALAQLSGLINNMLLLAKTQKGLSDTQLKDVNLGSLLTKLVEYYDVIAEDKNIRILTQGQIDSVKGDEGLLQRLFANVLSNAIYYAKNDSVISIEAAAPVVTQNQAPQDTVTIVMTNELDEPMTQAEANRLFERFYRHHKTRQTQAGTGLGLSIVKSIAQAHNGQISVAVSDDYLFKMTITLQRAGSH